MILSKVNHSSRYTASLRLVLYFLLIFLITVFIMSYFIYKYFSSSFKNEIMEYNDKALNQFSTFCDEFILNNINELVISLALQNTSELDMDSFINGSDNYNRNKWETILPIKYKLNNLVLRNRSLVDSIYVYSKNQNFVVSQSLLKDLNEKDAASSDEFSWINQITASGKSLLWIKTHNTVIHSDEANSMGDIITVVSTYPLFSLPQNAQAYIAINIKEKAFRNYLVNFNSDYIRQLIIINGTGSVISHSDNSYLYADISKEYFVKKILLDGSSENFACKYKDVEYIVSYRKSVYNDWYYISLVPKELFYQKDYTIRTRIFQVSALVLILILVLSILFSYSVYSPFKKILKKYSDTNCIIPGNDASVRNYPYEYRLFDNILSNMSDKICSLQEVFDKNLVMIRRNFFKDLLCNKDSSIEDLKEMLNSLDIRFNFKYFAAAVFVMDRKAAPNANHPANIQLARYNIINYISSLSEENCSFIPVDVSSTDISVIINSHAADYCIIRKFTKLVEAFCHDNFNFYLIAGVGGFIDNIAALNQSNIEARIAMQYKFLYPEEKIFYHNEIAAKVSDTVSIPEEFGIKLDKNLNLADIDQIIGILDKSISYMLSNKVSCRIARKEISKYTGILMNYISNTGLLAEEALNYRPEQRLLNSESIAAFRINFLACIRDIFNYISSKKTNRNYELVCAVEDYISNNIQLELSLKFVADEFHLSTQYLSKIFKEEKGMNFIDYIAVCKIEKAKKLLVTTNMGVSEITENIGYSHATYFARKFKELTGMTPSSYRRENCSKDIEIYKEHMDYNNL